MFNLHRSSIFITSAYLCLSICICTKSTHSFNELNPLITYNKSELQISTPTNAQFLDATQKVIISEGGPSFLSSNKFNLNNSTILQSDEQPHLLSSLEPYEINSSKIHTTAGNYSTQPIHQTMSISANNTMWEVSSTDYSISTKEINASDVFAPEENVQKIVPRKGVEQTIAMDDVPTTSANNNPENSTLILKNLLPANNSVTSFVKDELKKNISDLLINETEESNIKSFPPLTRKKSKPLTTLDEFKRNISVSAKPNSTDAKKNDYVIPVVAVILAVPLISVLVMFFYKKGTEFWERRHYRRMDFLIDGMYND